MEGSRRVDGLRAKWEVAQSGNFANQRSFRSAGELCRRVARILELVGGGNVCQCRFSYPRLG